MKNISIMQFKSEIDTYQNFTFISDSPFKPASVTMRVDEVFVSPFGSPYILLRNKYGEICLRHIISIYKTSELSEKVYEFTCMDYSHLPSAPDINIKKIICS